MFCIITSFSGQKHELSRVSIQRDFVLQAIFSGAFSGRDLNHRPWTALYHGNNPSGFLLYARITTNILG